MWPLTDITIYSDHESVDKDFARKANYICDLYHNRLDGYKPPKTSRICLHLSTLTINRPPIYIGSICEHYCHFNYENYEKLASKLKQFACILDLAHQAVMELAEIFKWDKTPFIRSYESIIIDNFRFIKEYPIKKSKDRCNAGQAILEKTVSDVT